MPLRPTPKFNAIADRMLEIPQPAIGGLNLKDLEYEQDVNQSPYMLNMMYRNGAFSKRYGQAIESEYNGEIYAMSVYRGNRIVHSGDKIYNGTSVIASGIPLRKGLFVLFNQNLYYFCGSIYSYNGTTWAEVTPYIPTIIINRKPDGSSGDTSESYNMIGKGFQNNFHGDGTSTVFKLTDKNLDQTTPKVLVDNEEWVYDASLSNAKTFKVNYTTGEVTLKTAAPEGTNNVEIIAYKHDAEWDDYYNQIVNSKYFSCFGGNNNSRLFLAGGGKSTYYYSEVYDASYFPYINYARVGNGADDITGFGQQYNVLLVFKPTEIYSLTYYQQSNSTTTDESQIGIGAFSSQVVNAMIGCDSPDSIQLINNQLTWFSSKVGVCTLVSTNIIDERNVRVISRNIDHTNNMGVKGILDYDEDPSTLKSIDYDSKYFLALPISGICFVWDYNISPYRQSLSGETAPSKLSWFIFDHFFVGQFLKYGKELLYASSLSRTKLIKLNSTFEDPDFNEDGEPDSIHSYYMTPFMQFNAVEYLKNVKNLYIQCRGDTNTLINMYYYTDDSSQPEADPEPVSVGGGGDFWQEFAWGSFIWYMNIWGNTFRRKCNLKKIQMAAVYFENDEAGKDMSITHVGFQYQIIKNVR